MRLDATRLELNNPRVHRKDLDFAVSWAKIYGKGRIYYSTLGHVEQHWDDPGCRKYHDQDRTGRVIGKTVDFSIHAGRNASSQLETDYRHRGVAIVAIQPNDPKAIRIDELDSPTSATVSTK
jgi:hypothetical protein